MTSIEDRYFARIGQILGARVPSATESRVFMLETGAWDTVSEARQILDSIKRKRSELSNLAEEIGEAERRYERSLFGREKAVQCKAVLLTLAQILPALASQETEIAAWITDQERQYREQDSCPKCGKPRSHGDRFCPQCGARLA